MYRVGYEELTWTTPLVHKHFSGVVAVGRRNSNHSSAGVEGNAREADIIFEVQDFVLSPFFRTIQ